MPKPHYFIVKIEDNQIEPPEDVLRKLRCFVENDIIHASADNLGIDLDFVRYAVGCLGNMGSEYFNRWMEQKDVEIRINQIKHEMYPFDKD